MILLVLSIVWLLVVAGLLARAITQYRHYHVLRPITQGAAAPPLPTVTAIVPARNEQRIIGRCLEGLSAQDYPPDELEILVVDDNSEDQTASIVRDAASRDARVRLIGGEPLPAGWLGKPHACAQAAAVARGEWLCFIDADTIGEPPLIHTAMRAALEHKLDLLSLQPVQELVTPAERLILPAGFFLIAFTQDLRRTNDPARPDASVDGQFLLVRRTAYEAVGGHAAVRDAVAEDSALARRLKHAGHTLAVFGTERLLHARMYNDFRSLWEGTARQAASLLGGPAKLVAAAIIAAVMAAAALALPAWGAIAVATAPGRAGGAAIASLVVASVASLAILGTHVGAARYFRIPIGYGLLFPLAYAAGAGVLIFAAWQRTRRQTRWKGRVYPRDAGPKQAHSRAGDGAATR